MRRLCVVLALVAACKPDLGSPASLVDSNRYLAIVSEPPEVAPGDPVTLHALIVTPDGQVADSAGASWAICTTPKPVSVDNAVSDDCVFDAQQAVDGAGLVVQATVPMDACSVFGPDPPQSPPGQPPLRPTDPDPTGGYFQPVRSLLEDDPQAKHFIEGFGLPRITCNLPDAPIDVATAYREQYTANQNPVIARVLVSLDGATGVDLPATVPAGQEVTFEVLWTADSAESFPVFDRTTRTLVTTREALRVSWFATDGAFAHDHTGTAADDLSTSTQNLWTAPPATAAETVHLWVVLRDSRGGTAVQSFDVDVAPVISDPPVVVLVVGGADGLVRALAGELPRVTAASLEVALAGEPPDAIVVLAAPATGRLVARVIAWADRRAVRPGVIAWIADGGAAAVEAALAAGVDDAVSGAASPRELAARVRAVDRRVRRASRVPARLRYGTLVLAAVDQVVWVDGAPHPLSRQEFAVLRALVAAGGVAMTRDALLDAAWGARRVGVGPRAVDNVIVGLRRKLGPRDRIRTVRGVGFRVAR